MSHETPQPRSSAEPLALAPIVELIGNETRPFLSPDWQIVPDKDTDTDEPRRLIRIIRDTPSGRSAVLTIDEHDLWAKPSDICIRAFDAADLTQQHPQAAPDISPPTDSASNNPATKQPNCYLLYVTGEGMLTQRQPANFQTGQPSSAPSRADDLVFAMRLVRNI